MNWLDKLTDFLASQRHLVDEGFHSRIIADEKIVDFAKQLIEAELTEARKDERDRIGKAFGKLYAAVFAVRFYLDQPYPDDPRWTPYTRFVGPRMEMVKAALKGEVIGDLEGMHRIAELQSKQLKEES